MNAQCNAQIQKPDPFTRENVLGTIMRHVRDICSVCRQQFRYHKGLREQQTIEVVKRVIIAWWSRTALQEFEKILESEKEARVRAVSCQRRRRAQRRHREESAFA